MDVWLLVALKHRLSIPGTKLASSLYKWVESEIFDLTMMRRVHGAVDNRVQIGPDQLLSSKLDPRSA